MDPDPELGKFKAGSGSGINSFGSTTLVTTVRVHIKVAIYVRRAGKGAGAKINKKNGLKSEPKLNNFGSATLLL